MIVPVVVFQIANLRTEEDIKEEIPLILAGPRPAQNDFSVQTSPSRCCRRHDRMIGLCAAHSEDNVGSLFQNCRKVIFELPRLVAPHGKSGLVVSLDQEPCEPERL